MKTDTWRTSCDIGAETGVRSHKPRNAKGARCHQKVGERHGVGSPSQPSAETRPVDTVILDFWLPGCEREKFVF